MSESNGRIGKLTKLCKAFSSENRVELFLKLVDKKKPKDIAVGLGITRAGLQKHLDALLETGLLVKQGSGRNTKYTPTKISHLVLRHLEHLGSLLEIQHEVFSLESTLSAIESVPSSIEETSKDEFVASLKAELEKRIKTLEDISKALHSYQQ